MSSDRSVSDETNRGTILRDLLVKKSVVHRPKTVKRLFNESMHTLGDVNRAGGSNYAWDNMRFKKKLGTGAFGEVDLMEAGDNKELVAIKTLTPQGQSMAKLFFDEAR